MTDLTETTTDTGNASKGATTARPKGAVWAHKELEPVPLHKRFTLETLNGDDWNEVPDLYELHQQLQQDEAKRAQATA